MGLSIETIMKGVAIYREAKRVVKPLLGNHVVRPIAGGGHEHAHGPDVVDLLRQAFPGAKFLWLSKPVSPAAPDPLPAEPEPTAEPEPDPAEPAAPEAEKKQSSKKAKK